MESLRKALGERYNGNNRSHDSDVAYALFNDSSNRTPLDDGYIPEPEAKCIQEAPLSNAWDSSAVLNSSLMIRRVRSSVVICLLALLPSFLRQSTKPRKLYKTSYLDGLRGVAALFVVFHHYSLRFTPSVYNGWHSDKDWFFQLPLVRVVHSGRFMVAIFFVVSGYVLSYRGLKLAREGQPVALLDSLASSVFRRWLRLHLPVIASTFTAFLLARANLWTNLPQYWVPAVPLRTPAPLPTPEGNFTSQFWDWYADTVELCDPFRYGVARNSKYNINNLWTIPIEWMNSMLVFATVLAIARTKTLVKLTVLSFLVYWCHQTTRTDPAIFLSGVLLAEMSFIRAEYFKSKSPLPVSEKTRPDTLHACLFLLSRLFWTCLFISGLYVGSIPQKGAGSSPGYIILIEYLPAQYQRNVAKGGGDMFWLSVGAFLIVFSLENAPYLQCVFTTPFAQYLGDISFSLYLLHGQIEYTLGQWIVPKCMAITGGWANGLVGFLAGMGLACLACVPVTFWASDLFTRAVDRKSVNFAKWLNKKCFLGA